MIFIETKLKGAFILDIEKREDSRGYFSRTFCMQEFESHGLNFNFVQGNMSRSTHKHTLRGMHYQSDGTEEVKLVRCTKGAVFDVIIDVRKTSPTHGQYITVELSEENARQIYIPKGFAHGFLTLTSYSEVAYLVSEYYSPKKEKGIRWNDPYFKIAWPTNQPFLSKKDQNYDDYLR